MSSLIPLLGVSQRTFARHLATEGVTYFDLLEKLRSDLAERYLADGDLTISEIAWLLDYSDVGSFSHAFKRWTGKTPREWRSSPAKPRHRRQNRDHCRTGLSTPGRKALSGSLAKATAVSSRIPRTRD
jgi:AraC-like DNA-binding protein